MTRSVSYGNPSTVAPGELGSEGGSVSGPRAERDAPLVDELVLHDLMGPLSGALGQLQMLQMQLESQPRAGSKADAAYAALCELSEMVSTLQYLMHLEQGTLGEPAQRLGVRSLLEEVAAAIHLPADEADDNGVVVSEVSTALTVHGCHQLLRQALCGLTRVGLRLCRQAPVSLGADSTAERGVRFTVSYEGRPLPDEVVEKLFDLDLEQIQRQHAVRIDRAHSLMLVASAAEAHSGAAGYEHRPRGGCFWIELPGDPAQPAG